MVTYSGFKKKVVNKIFLWVFLMILSGTAGAAEGEGIIAEGEAVGNSPQAREQALNRALRDAVENGVGVYISSESKVKNFQLLEDKIYSRVKGYVKSYEILSDNKGEEGIYKIKIRAEVSADKLEKDLSDLGLLMIQKGKPRTIILISEDIEQTGWRYSCSGEGLTAQTEMEKVFLGKGFPLVSKEQLEAIQQKDVALSFNDPARAAALGQRYGAELVIVGQAVSDVARTSAPYGIQTHTYTAEVQAKAVKVDTAGIIVSDSRSAQQSDQGKFVAARKAIKKASEEMAQALIEQITASWREEIYNTVSVQIVVDKIKFDQLTKLEETLKGLEGVQNVFRRSFSGGVVMFELELKGKAEQLALDVSSISEPKLEITGTTQNRIDASVKE